MWGTTLVAAACVLALIAFSFAIGAPILAVPVAIVGLVVMGVLDMRRRREQAKEKLAPR